MFKNVTPIIIKALSPIHAGSGRELGIVDMPIQRESHTGIPKIEGSSVKGSMREGTRLKEGEEFVRAIFGEEKGDKGAGVIGFSDAKLLFYPIKTLSGIFAYVTCPYLLERFAKELDYVQRINHNGEKDNQNQCDNLADLVENADMLSQEETIILILDEAKSYEKDTIELDEYSFTVKSNDVITDALLKNIPFQPQRHLVVLCDEDFMEMMSLCKEIITRNRINPKTGTVVEGGLFSEEYLPAESILYTLLLENGIETDGKVAEKVAKYKKYFQSSVLTQIGGNVNIGKGIVEMKSLVNTGGGENGDEKSQK